MGLKQEEAQTLTWNDINFSKKELTIKKTLTTKLKGEKWTISTPKTKNSTRTLPLPKIVLERLKTLKEYYKKEYDDFSNNWFVFQEAFPLKETTICKKKNSYCKLGGVQQIRIHDFRHSFASMCIEKDVPIGIISEYLGHENISTTLDIYGHLYPNSQDKLIYLLNKQDQKQNQVK